MVVGGGSVGLFLGLRLRLLGVEAVVLEQRTAPATHTRAIGIHPPSLELLESMGVATTLVDQGVSVRRGVAVGDDGPLGTLSFEGLPEPFDFVLSIPQYLTEAALESRLAQVAPDALVRGARVVARAGRLLRYETTAGEVHEVEARWIAGCDGKDSLVRRSAGIRFPGGPYADTFAMGDFEDHTSYGADAVLFLHSQGLVECFPLPGGLRRWVTWTTEASDLPPNQAVRGAVSQRTPYHLDDMTPLMASRFRVYRHRAERLISGRVVLAGDAAHQMSPMGGQGMNTGFMDAWTLAEALTEALGAPHHAHEHLSAWERTRIRSADKAIRRAETNMRLGRGGWWTRLRDPAISWILRSSLSGWLAQTFTMRGL